MEGGGNIYPKGSLLDVPINQSIEGGDYGNLSSHNLQSQHQFKSILKQGSIDSTESLVINEQPQLSAKTLSK